MANCKIEESIESEMDGNLRDGLLVLTASVREFGNSAGTKKKSDREGNTKAKLVLGTKEVYPGCFYNILFNSIKFLFNTQSIDF